MSLKACDSMGAFDPITITQHQEHLATTRHTHNVHVNARDHTLNYNQHSVSPITKQRLNIHFRFHRIVDLFIHSLLTMIYLMHQLL